MTLPKPRDCSPGWAGQPHVSASVKRAAGVRGDLDHYGALGFLQGLLTILRDSDYAGLVLVLDEVETLQRMRSDVRGKSLNALRQLLDEIDGGRFPGLYLVMTGTPAFFDGQQGVQRLPPLAQRLADRLPDRRTVRQSAGSPDPAARVHRLRRSWSSVPGSATSSPPAPKIPTGSTPLSTTPTSGTWPGRLGVSSADARALRRDSS